MNPVNTLTSLLAGIFIFSACSSGPCIDGSGNVTSNARELNGFTSISLSGAYEVEFTQSPDELVEVVAEDNLQEYIKTSIRGTKLIIENDRDLCTDKRILIRIHAKDLLSIEVNGAVNVKMTNTLTTDNFRFEASGNTDSEISVNTQSLSTDLSGAGKLIIKGQTVDHDIKSSGANVVEALGLITNRCTIDLSGASSASVNILSELSGSLSGACKLQYRGNPTKLSVNQSGASSITKDSIN